MANDLLIVKMDDGNCMTQWKKDWTGIDIDAEAAAMVAEFHPGKAVVAAALAKNPDIDVLIKQESSDVDSLTVTAKSALPANHSPCPPDGINFSDMGDADLVVGCPQAGA